MLHKRHWSRWIHSSIVTYLKGVCDSENIASLVSGVEDRTTAFAETPDRVEIRVTGPTTTSPNSTEYILRVYVNCLVTSNLGHNKDRYTLDRLGGIMYEALCQPIPVYKCGPDTDGVDDGTCIDCLHVVGEDNLGIRFIKFATPDENDQVVQGMAAATYEVTFTEANLNRPTN